MKKQKNNCEGESILGYSITNKSKNNCVLAIVDWIQNGSKRKYFVYANPHSLEVARKDREFDRAIRNADLIVPDGVGILIASKMLGGAICKRITGSDLSEARRLWRRNLISTPKFLPRVIRAKKGTDTF